MAKLPLNAYLQEIEQMLNREARQEAIGHCKYILETFPKHIGVYRLLGRAYLGTRQPNEAADMYRRILSAIPDDRDAHLYLSGIYEDNDIDAAVFHLERAFEHDPEDPDLQSELRALYARRENSPAPDRLQMTLPALARRYHKGKLTSEAIRELLRILDAEPNRVDLRGILAQAYWEEDRHKDAVELSLEVLQTLPDHLQCNRMLATLWLALERPTDAAPFMKRLTALDPYLAWSVVQPDVAPPPDAFALERLNWKARSAQLATDVPDWVANIGDALETADGVSLGSAPVPPSASRPASGRLGQAEAASTGADWLNDLSLDDQPAAADDGALDANWLAEESAAQAEWLMDAEPAAPVDPGAWLNTGSLDPSMLPSEADLQAAASSADQGAPVDPMAWLGTGPLPSQPTQPAATSDQDDFESFFLQSLEQDPSEITQLSIPTAPVKLPPSDTFAFDAPDAPSATQEPPDFDLFSTFESSAPTATEDAFDLFGSSEPVVEPPASAATQPTVPDYEPMRPINPTADDAGFWDSLNAVESRTMPTIEHAPPPAPATLQAPAQSDDFAATFGDASAMASADAADVDLESSLSMAAPSESFDVDSLALDQFDEMALDALEFGEVTAPDLSGMPEMASAMPSFEALDALESETPDLDAPLELPWMGSGAEGAERDAALISPLDSASLLDDLDWLAPVEDLTPSAELSDTGSIGDPNALMSELGLSPVDEAPISSQSLLDASDLAEFEKLRAETGDLSEQSPNVFPPRESAPETPAGQLTNTAMLAWLSANSEPNLIDVEQPEENLFEPSPSGVIGTTSAITPPHEIELEEDWFAAFEAELDQPTLTPSSTSIPSEGLPLEPTSDIFKSEPLFAPEQPPVPLEGALPTVPSDEAETLAADFSLDLADEGGADAPPAVEEEAPAVGDANWLSRVRGNTKSLSRGETGVLNAADAPDWLAAFGGTPPATLPVEPAPAAASEPDDLGGLADLGALGDLGESPAWLTEISDESADELSLTASASAQDSDDFRPDWLSSFGAPTEEPALPEIAAELPSAPNDAEVDVLTDILPGLLGEEPQASALPLDLSFESLSDTLEPAEPAAESPDWLGGMGFSEPTTSDMFAAEAPEISAMATESQPTDDFADLFSRDMMSELEVAAPSVPAPQAESEALNFDLASLGFGDVPDLTEAPTDFAELGLSAPERPRELGSFDLADSLDFADAQANAPLDLSDFDFAPSAQADAPLDLSSFSFAPPEQTGDLSDLQRALDSMQEAPAEPQAADTGSLGMGSFSFSEPPAPAETEQPTSFSFKKPPAWSRKRSQGAESKPEQETPSSEPAPPAEGKRRDDSSGSSEFNLADWDDLFKEM